MVDRELTLSNPYYSWLFDWVNMYPNRHNRYFLLIKALHEKRFSWFVPNDDNRAFEGKNLRERFCEEKDVDYEEFKFESEASILELILALAFRCDSIMADTVDNVSIGDWFWRLLTNIELDKFTDDDYDCLGGDMAVDRILDRVINRTYHRSGKGGLFPLKLSKKDQRKIELWYQMCQYLVENYYIQDMFV